MLSKRTVSWLAAIGGLVFFWRRRKKRSEQPTGA